MKHQNVAICLGSANDCKHVRRFFPSASITKCSITRVVCASVRAPIEARRRADRFRRNPPS